MELTGTIVKIFDERRISEKLTVREFVIKTGDTYPQEVIMQLANAKCDQIIGMKNGDSVTAHINIRGRKGNNEKWYNTIEAWKLEKQ